MKPIRLSLCAFDAESQNWIRTPEDIFLAPGTVMMAEPFVFASDKVFTRLTTCVLVMETNEVAANRELVVDMPVGSLVHRHPELFQHCDGQCE